PCAIRAAIEDLESRIHFNAVGRWSQTALDSSTGAYGTPVRLTWSIVGDGLSIPGRSQDPFPAALPSNLFAKSTGIDTWNNWVNRMTYSLATWANVSGLTYYPTFDDGAQWGSDGVAYNPGAGVIGRGDVRIA